MNFTFGARLRQQREERQIELADIAAATKIKLSLLEDLERDDISRWPGGIFRRAYLRAYAAAIGLDPDALIREFLELHPDLATVLPPGSTRWPDEDTSEAALSPATRLRHLVSQAMAGFPPFLQRPQPSTAAQAARSGDDLARADARGDPGASVPGDRVLPLIDAPAGGDEGTTREVPNLSDAARLCHALSQASSTSDVTRVFGDIATTLDAVGIAVWKWDPRAAQLAAHFMHGYPDEALARWPAVALDDDNAIAAACRNREACVIGGDDEQTSALAIPLLVSGRCVGVLALEFRSASEQREAVHACATILAPALAGLLRRDPPASSTNGLPSSGTTDLGGRRTG